MASLIEIIGDKFADLRLEAELLFHKKTPQPEPKTLGSIVTREKFGVNEKLPISLKMIRLPGHDRWSFYDQMATLVGSGVTLIDSLSLLQAQSKNASHKKLYAEMIRRINGGMTLADTMGMFPRAFSTMQSALVEAGEKSGNLKTVFSRIADDLESQQEFSRKITGAMFYPLVVFVLALAMVGGMVTFVIPKVSKLYEESHVKLPGLTQAVINISRYISLNYPILLGVTVLIIFAFWFLINKTRVGKWAWESFVSSLPVIGKISLEKNIMMFASNLGMLLESGVLISSAFEITEKTLNNLHYRKSLAKIRHGVLLGKNVSEMMGLKDIKAQRFEVNPLFPLQVAQMIHIGEMTGNLAKMLVKIRQNYARSVDFMLKNLSTLVEPLMIFLVALMVGSVLLAVMLPFFNIGATIH